jgi:hypothetical protein
MICTEIDGGLFSVGAQDSSEQDAGDRRGILVIEVAGDFRPRFLCWFCSLSARPEAELQQKTIKSLTRKPRRLQGTPKVIPNKHGIDWATQYQVDFGEMKETLYQTELCLVKSA